MACGRQTRHLDGSAVSQDRLFLLAGAISGFVGVGAGAFGAHGLRARLTPELLSVFETAVRYQMYHALALLGVAVLTTVRGESGLLTASGWLFVAGMLLFSGSLYLLSVTGVRMFGAITPLGGVCFLLGWALLFVSVLRG